MHDDPLSILKSWKSFLPADAVVMAKRRTESSEAIPEVSESYAKLGVVATGVEGEKARILFKKILAALDLAPGDFEVLSDASEKFSGPVLVQFTATADEAASAGVWENRDRCSVLTTFSIPAMLAEPGLKKVVWSHVKEAIARVR